MQARRLAAVLAAVLLTSVAAVAAAPSALAATYQVSACQNGSFTANYGDTVIVVFEDYMGQSGCGVGFVESSGSPSVNVGNWSYPGNDACLPIEFGAGGSVMVVGAINNGATFTMNIETADGSSMALAEPATCGDPAAAAPVPDWLQAYGRASADEPCAAGWAPSWHSWHNRGAGGWVCHRSIPSLG